MERTVRTCDACGDSSLKEAKTTANVGGSVYDVCNDHAGALINVLTGRKGAHRKAREELTCQDCGQVVRGNAGLAAHQRFKHEKRELAKVG